MYSSVLLIKFLWKEADARERRQAVFMETGFLMLFVATVFFGIILPVYFNELRFFNFGPQFSFFLIFFSSYAILRHRLFDIELLVKKGAVFTVLFAIVVFLFNAIISLLARILPGFVSTLAAALIITVIFSPLKSWLERVTDRVFFRHRRTFTEAIDLLNAALTHSQTIEDLMEKLVGVLRSVTKTGKIAVLLVDEHNVLSPYRKRGLGVQSVRLHPDSAILEYLYYRISHGYNALEVIEQDDLEYRISYEYIEEDQKARLIQLQKEFSTLGYKAVIPFISNGKILGVMFLGEKLSGDRYIDLDFRVLGVMAHEGSIAIENAFNAERAIRLNELKTEFIHVISHQLRTPLTAAKWTVELLLSKNNPEDLAEALADIQVNLMSINEGVNSMVTVMTLAQQEVALEKRKTDVLKSVVSDAVHELRSLATKKKVKIAISADPKHIQAVVDAEKLKKIVSVLVSNAITYSPDGGKVSVNLVREKEDLIMSVEDEGIGVPKKNRKEIFEKFFRGAEAKRVSPSGLGVNLFIAREFATMHHGKLWVEDRPDGQHGARFVLSIPVS